MNTNTEKFKIRLGVFILTGLVIFAIAIFIIGRQKNLFDPVVKIYTTFYNVSGLQVGNMVRFSGINVGTVDKIAIINDSTVQVGMLIKKSVQPFIKSDSQVGIGSEGIIGDRILIISQGGSNTKTVQEGEELLSSEPIETDEIIASLEITAHQAEIITKELSEIMVSINSGKGTIGKLIHDPTIATNLGKTMDNLKASSKGLEENMEAAKSNFLLRGFFKKKETDERKKTEALEKAAAKKKKDLEKATADKKKEDEKEAAKKKKAAEKEAKKKKE
ncbi:MAG: MCE family protein [Saprospiraceae bacterium]|nr:MCE family protein [Saprospiraceae bacterium]